MRQEQRVTRFRLRRRSSTSRRVAEVGYTLRLTVTATNAFGKLVMQSDPTEPISATPPHLKGRRIVGNGKGEYLAGGGRDDVILGNGGNDTILGGAGDDRIDGGPGNDIITGGSGADRLLGGAGSDTIYAADGERDIIDCGAGHDRAVIDSVDKATNCEVTDSGSASARDGSGGSGDGSGDSGGVRRTPSREFRVEVRERLAHVRPFGRQRRERPRQPALALFGEP